MNSIEKERLSGLYKTAYEVERKMNVHTVYKVVLKLADLISEGLVPTYTTTALR